MFSKAKKAVLEKPIEELCEDLEELGFTLSRVNPIAKEVPQLLEHIQEEE